MTAMLGKGAALVFFLSLAVVAVRAQKDAAVARLPDAPQPVAALAATVAAAPNAVVFHKKLFWSLVGVQAAAVVADAQISELGLQMCPHLIEKQSAWLYGRRPSLARYYATDAFIDGGAALLGYRMVRSRRKFVKAFGWTLVAGSISAHTEGAITSLHALNSNCH